MVAACSGGNKGSANQNKLAKISIFQSKVEIAEQLEALAKQYTKETGNEVEVWGSVGDAYITQLQAKLTANQGPSIFSIGYGSEAETFKSYYYDLSNEPYVKDIAPNMALEIDGKVVGVPYGVEGFGLVYNKNLVNPAFKTRLEMYENALALPSKLTFQFYSEAMQKMSFLTAFGNSLYVTLTSVVIVVILASMTAWMLVRTDNWVSRLIFLTFVSTMLIPFQTIMMPLMQVMDWIRSTLQIPMLNTHEGLIYMNVGFHAGMAVFLYHGEIRSCLRRPIGPTPAKYFFILYVFGE